MSMRSLLVACALLAGPVACRPRSNATRAPANEHALYEGRTGAPMDLADFVGAAGDADFVVFGELHGHPVGARYELDLLRALARGDRPLVLAMEFFEADQQADLDAYLAGALDEAAFRERTHRTDVYDRGHRALIELCKTRGIPVLAANAPRRLVRGYRTFGGSSYDAYLASLSSEDRALLPRSVTPPSDAFRRKFLDFMGPKRGPAFLPSMLLWNDAMAESAAEARARDPRVRVLLVVGAFHVAGGLGLVESYRARRPDDTVQTLVMVPVSDGPLHLRDEQRGEGDAVLLVRPAPEPPPAAGGATKR